MSRGADHVTLCIGVACAATFLGAVDATAAPPAMSAWQEIVLLTVIKAQHAAAGCGFHVEQGEVDAMLRSAALDAGAVARQAVSPSVRRQITADSDAYEGDRETACNQAWDRFGADGAPGLRGLLTR